jgi:hypothetical protein
MFLNREALLKREKLQIKKVEFEDGDFTYVRQMTGMEKDTFEEGLLEEVKDASGEVVDFKRSYSNFRAQLAVATLCDEQGNLLMKPGDAPLLGIRMTASKLMRIAGEATKLNSISKSDQEKIVKNSVGGQSDVSHSDSARK